MQNYEFNKVQVNYPLPVPLEVSEILPDIYNSNFYNQDLPPGSYIIDESGLLLKEERREIITGKDSEGKDLVEIVESFSPFDLHGYFTIVFSDFIEDEDTKKLTSVTIQYTVKYTDNKFSAVDMDTYITYDASGLEESQKQMQAELEKQYNLFRNKYFFNTKAWQFIKMNFLVKPTYYLKYFVDNFYFFITKDYEN